ncbi:UDP-N-acetylmuramoyl-L-alanine--D-glutamate ligase [Actinobacteria bacterium YIM 96077]|uniref:UDP-N-acetylmuramoylalanine--D-glutamate ligase n=1 Tax=Phytoactinopolyspora halophila TaxID=1981511 RepID=A0A329QVM9_9ACTN|nr:UDP-N-acetylmuramoyl-L-alanine--D-glutamate ligase [Phytoactinopolyspora halophila]AYY12842.1 UDP-N-acetylmuramoyl-L-alanine--D-glutamate ligase [Actinobacteria bacterium YIM 96077]RAW16365.1 UDP-N-acetylmuramoyl-L-alanine--D-glutamate ligase [Phytoactinopolyspora halophila]
MSRPSDLNGPEWVQAAERNGPWPELSVVVAGIGVSGFAAADALVRLGARVTVVDEHDGTAERERATVLHMLGAAAYLGPGSTASLPEGTDLVVTSPGWRSDAPLLAAAAASNVPVWGEVELAWRLRDRSTPWLALTGTNGKTTTLRMLTQMLRASGLRVGSAGNVGDPIVSAVLDPAGHDVLAVELSSFQLHWTHSLAVRSAAVLNVAPDHLDWHGTMDAYAADKGRIYQGVESSCVYNVADPVTERLVREADVVEGARAIGFTLDVPRVGMVGVVDGVLVDRAFVDERQTSAAELASVDDVRPSAPHNVANALAAAALARSLGVPPVAVRDGLRGYEPDPHRAATVATIDDVTFVDDSKATNTHAATAALGAYESIVWIAGGLAKGATFDELVLGARDRLRGVVLMGTDRSLIRASLARHAPEVPVVEVTTTDNMAMEHAVRAAADMARRGDTVLLAPACASMDMFVDYASRGDAFAAAVRRHGDR